MTPEEDERNFWVRLADNWYGPAASEPFVAPDGRTIRGWNPDIPSVWAGFPGARSDTEAVGYYRLDTGRPTRDAILSVLVNQLGIDNAMRATMARQSGDMGWNNYWREIAGGAVEVALFGKTAVGAAGGRLLTRGLPAVINTLRRAPVTTVTQTGPSVTQTAIRQLGGELGAVRDLVRAYTPISINTARTGARPITQIRPSQIPGQILDAAGNLATRFGQAGWAGVRRRLAPSNLPGGRFGAIAGLAGLGLVAYGGRPGSEIRPTATEAAGRPSPTDPPPDTPRTITDVTPVGDPITDAGNGARNDVAAINRQYNNILRELQGMYQLSETEEERERLRFMLADIEAQRDAGLEAISQGYAQTVAAIQERGEISRQQTAERAERFGSQLEGYADRTAQRMMLQNLEQQQQFRGLGSGSQTPVNEWVGLMSAMAPLQQQYTQRMGDITGEGIDWLAGTVGAQGQAQQADLQRLAAATRSASIMSHQRQVDDRIQREREAQRAAILQTMQMQAGALGGSGEIDPFERLRSIEAWALNNYGPGFIEQSLRDAGQASLTPGELARIEVMNQRALGQIPPDAAGTPLSPDGS